MRPPTKQEHDAWVAVTGRPYTDRAMNHAKRVDDDATDSGFTILDQVIADSRRATGAS